MKKRKSYLEVPEVSSRQRRRRLGNLGWALLVSLLLNHTILLPAAYLLLGRGRQAADRVVQVELVEEPGAEPEALAVQPPDTPRRRPSRDPLPRLLPEPRKEQEKVSPPREEPPPPEPERPLPPPERTPLRLKMVEVSNPESDKPPPDARFLSDKNRRVEQETRARHTNLEKDHPRPEPLSQPSPLRRPEPGAQKEEVAETQEQRARRHRTQVPAEVSPLLSMRSPAPAARAEQRVEEVQELAEAAEGGDLARARRARPLKEGRPRQTVNLVLDHRSHDRVYGKQASRERELARLSPSKPRGRHHEKWKRIQAALENFIPEVRPGNQTALGTRADPFALYIARMHRDIHRLWGYGFLVDLDTKPDGHPMNNMGLWSMIEIVITPDGKVEKATIVKHSGILPYDVAALDTVFTASPYPPTPRAIRSADGKAYLHWRFHRDQRQCGTFGVDPFILTKPPKGPIDSDMAEVGRTSHTRSLRRLSRAGGGLGQGGVPATPHGAAAPAAARNLPRSPGRQEPEVKARSPDQRPGSAAPPVRPVRSDDPAALQAARRFVQGFEQGDVRAMAGACSLPFSAWGRKVASDHKELQQMFEDLVREIPSGRASILKLMTVMEARRHLRRLPPGAEHGVEMLVGRVRLGSVPVTLLLQRRSGQWRVTGLNR